MFLCSSAVLCSCFLSLSSVTDLKMSGWNQMAALQLPGFRAALQTHRCRSWISDLFHLVHAQSKKKKYRSVSYCCPCMVICMVLPDSCQYILLFKKILIYGVHFHGLCHCSVTKTFNFKCDSWACCPFVVRIFRTFRSFLEPSVKSLLELRSFRQYFWYSDSLVPFRLWLLQFTWTYLDSN